MVTKSVTVRDRGDAFAMTGVRSVEGALFGGFRDRSDHDKGCRSRMRSSRDGGVVVGKEGFIAAITPLTSQRGRQEGQCRGLGKPLSQTLVIMKPPDGRDVS
jgi:hypothetical protein